jgi:trimethylamine--corrinoid protein Co-methyltransferase
MARRRIKRNRSDLRKGRSGLTQIPFKPLKNPYSPLEIISQDQIETIHHASLRILKEIGLTVIDPDSRHRLKDIGCDVDENNQRVRFDPALVEELITGLPSEYTALARNREKNMIVGGNNIIFSTVVGPSFVNDLDRGRRPGTYDELCDFVKIAHSLNIIHQDGGGGFEPMDLPPETRHMDMMYAQITLTDKGWQPCWLNSRSRATDVIEMTCIALGISREELSNTPTIASCVNTNSPLLLDAELSEGLVVMAEAGQPVDITPFTMAGAMSPVPLAGTLAQQNAEVLAGFTLVQAVRRGCPCVYGHFATNVDMKTGSPAFGTPEYTKTTLASAQMARFYGVPFRSSNTTASAVVDAQAAYESEMSIWGTVMGHTNLVLHAAGWLEGGLTASFEKLILDAEMLQLIASVLEPIEVNESTLAFGAVEEVGPGGHFFAAADTLERYETAFYSPLVSDWRNFESWEIDGSKTATERANGIWKQLLADYEKPPIDPAIEEELQAYMARRREEIANNKN